MRRGEPNKLEIMTDSKTDDVTSPIVALRSTRYPVFRILLIALTLYACHASEDTSLHVIGGMPPDQSHPASWSTVELIDSRSGHTFCSASYIARNLIVTAAHCVNDLDNESFRVRFASSTTFPVTAVKTYKEAKKFGPNFDIAWVKFEGEPPSPYHPIEIWHDPSQLHKASKLEIAGFGFNEFPCVDESSTCNTGRLYSTWVDTVDYVSSIRLFSLLVTKGQENAGPCFVDSGGPAFMLVGDRWYLIGTFVGWDRILVPEEAETICKSGRGLYTFAGDYARWLEESFAVDLSFDARKNPRRPMPEAAEKSLTDPTTFAEWCLRSDTDSHSWYTVQTIIRLASDFRAATEDPDLARELFEDCEKADYWVRKMIASRKELILNASEQVDAGSWGMIQDLRPLLALADAGIESLTISESSIRDLSPLKSFPYLKRLMIRNNLADDGLPLDLSGFQELEEFSLQKSGNSVDIKSLESLASLRSLTLSNLETDELPLFPFGLRELTLDFVNFQTPLDLSLARNLRMLSVALTRVKALPSAMPELTDLRFLGACGLKALPLEMPKLQTLALSGTELSSISIGAWKALKSVLISDHRETLSVDGVSNLAEIQYLFITRNNLQELDSVSNLRHLEVLDLAQNRLAALPLLDNLPSLKELYAGYNVLSRVGDLPPGLIELDLSGNPLQIRPGEFRLKNLRSLSLAEIPGFSSIEDLGDLPSLEVLNLRGNEIRNVDGLLKFVNLRELILNSNRIDDISSLEGLGQLSYLEVIDNPIRSRVCPLRAGRCRFELFPNLTARISQETNRLESHRKGKLL